MKKSVLMLLTAATLMTAMPALAATEQSQDRQEGRDAKQACTEGAPGGNADCRQEKRDIKH